MLLSAGLASRAEQAGKAAAGEENPVPETYTLDYPEAEQCCPPIRSTFFEVTQTVGEVRGRQFRQQPNGGYGLPVADKVADQHLLHLGADLGWYQVGEPVFAVADGIVRRSEGPPNARDRRKAAAETPAPLAWGNLVVLEHRFGGDYITTLYGHLGADRRVEVGDVVRAGQMIGTIGRQKFDINGGYKPHLHFGVREGRNAEIGAEVFRLSIGGRIVAGRIKAVAEDQVEIDLPAEVPARLQVNLNGTAYRADLVDGKRFLPARLLWTLNSPDFPLVGYDLKTDGWRDPVAFLKEHNADSNPAPFLPAAEKSKRRR